MSHRETSPASPRLIISKCNTLISQIGVIIYFMNSFQKLYESEKQSAAYMIDEIKYICCHLEPRAPGSSGERKAAEYLASVLQRDCGIKEVETESFKEHPGSFYGYCRITGCLGVLSCLGLFLHPVISLTLSCLSLFLFLLYFVFYLPVIDPFFPEKVSTNVTGIRPCEKEIKRRILINGHIDAAWEFTLNYHFGGIVFEIPNAAALSGTIVYIILSILALCIEGPWIHTAAWLGCIFIPFFIAVGLTYNTKQITDGANDNLTGCYMGITLLHEMQQLGITLEHTELGVLLTGSEEAGLRGAKAWCQAHQQDFHDVPTYIITFDTIHDPRHLLVNERDLNSTLKSDAVLGNAFYQAAMDMGVPCKKGRVPLFGGSTDSSAFTRGGFRAVAITGLSHKLEDYYHTRKDTWDHLNPEGLENCYKALVRMIEMADQGFLDEWKNHL